MLEQITFTGRELLIAVILASLVYLVETLFFSRRRPKRPARLEERIAGLEKRLADLTHRLEHVEEHPPVGSALDSQSSVHAEAVRLAREGASPQDVAGQLGISRSEAELIVSLHQVKP